MYNHKGVYLDKQNGQKENTPTVIVTIGDSRKLKWRRRILVLDLVTGRYKWQIDKTWKHVMHISSGSIVIVNPLDEIPTQTAVIGMLIQYQHGGVIVNGSKFSCAYAFRVVKTTKVYNKSNEALNINGHTISNDEKQLLNSFDHLKFQTKLKMLYKLRFETEHFNISHIKNKNFNM